MPTTSPGHAHRFRFARLAALVLLGALAAVHAGIPGPLFWNPANGSNDGTLASNWSDDAAGTLPHQVAIAPTDVLSFDGTGPNSSSLCIVAQNLACAGLLSSLNPTVILRIDSTQAPVVLSVTATVTSFTTGTIDFTGVGGQLALDGSTHFFDGATFTNAALGKIRLIAASTTFIPPTTGTCPAVVAEQPTCVITGSGGTLAALSCTATGAVHVQPVGSNTPPGIITIGTANLDPGASAVQSGSRSLVTIIVAGFTTPGVDYSRVAVTGNLTITPGNSALLLDLTSLSQGTTGTAHGVITYNTRTTGSGFDATQIVALDSGSAVLAKPGRRGKPGMVRRKVGDALLNSSTGLFSVRVVDDGAGSIDVTVGPPVTVAPPPVVTFEKIAACVLEGHQVPVFLALSQASTGAVSVPLLFSNPITGAAATIGTDPVVLETGDDVTVDTRVVTFAPGETRKAVTFTAIDDGSSNLESDEGLVVTLDAQGVVGAVTSPGDHDLFTLTIVGQQDPVDFQFTGGARSFRNAGESIGIRVFDGIPPYIVTTSTNVRVVADAVRCDADINVDGNLDPSQFFLVSVIDASLATAFAVTDSTGAVVTPLSIPSGQVLSSGTSQGVAPRPVTASTGGDSIYTAVCPGTEEGLAALKAFLVGKDGTRVKAFAWDASTQAYVQLPEEPVGGLTPSHAIFLASRDATTLDFTGTQAPMPYTILLQPGFNFVGLPPLANGSATETQHGLNTNFTVRTLDNTPITDPTQRGAILGLNTSNESVAFLWDGTAYAEIRNLTTGEGVWIKNQGSESVLLVRESGNFSPSKPSAKVAGFASPTRVLGNPPPPPTGTRAAAGGSGGCGHGGGFTAMLLGVFLLVRLCLRRARMH